MGMVFPPPSVEELAWRADRLAERLPRESPATRARLLLSLNFANPSRAAFQESLAATEPVETWESTVFARNLATLRSACGGGVPELATIQFGFGYDGQVASIARALARRTDRSCVALVLGAYFDQRAAERLEESASLGALLVPRDEDLEAFRDVGMVFLNECFPCPWIGRGPVRVGLPHASLNPPELSVARFGAGAWFDVLFAAKAWPPLASDAFTDLYPREMVEHGSGSFCVVPAGSPKFDELVEACATAGTPARKIVYHLSLEKPWVYANLGLILRTLLEHLPSHEIVLRPHPVERTRPEILEQARQLEGEPRFRLSLAATYAEDYADAQCALVHDAEPVRNFPLASLRPVVQLDPSRPGTAPIPLGWAVSELGAAIGILQELDRAPGRDADRLRIERDRAVPHPGASVDHLVDRFEDLVGRRRVPGWTYYPLFSTDDQPEGREAFRKALARAAGLPHPCLALLRRAAERFPDEASFQFRRGACECEGAGEGLLYDRWHWTDGLVAVAEAWKLVRGDGRDSDLREEIRRWILQTGLRHALAWVWKEASGGAPGAAAETFSVLLSADAERTVPSRWPEATPPPPSAPPPMLEDLSRRAAQAWAKLGAERLEAGRDDLAGEALREALALQPDHVDAMFNLLLLERIQGNDGEALGLARNLWRLLPGDPDVARHLEELNA